MTGSPRACELLALTAQLKLRTSVKLQHSASTLPNAYCISRRAANAATCDRNKAAPPLWVVLT
jgi:hypothetical protein